MASIGRSRTAPALRCRAVAHHFICPNCGERTIAQDHYDGFRRDQRGCAKCGFGFVFELLDDYYPAPDAAFFVCDAEGRLIACGNGSFELTGYEEEQVIGQHVTKALGLRFQNGDDHVGTVLEWGVRALGKDATLRTDSDLEAAATADLFPAYEDEGGLLLVLTPRR
jgi:predicted RNA-binding Zn-ribbon protein involved in translation (DUF1610 family)